jgi:hypothetical protein
MVLKSDQHIQRTHRFDAGGIIQNESLVTEVLWSDAENVFRKVAAIDR